MLDGDSISDCGVKFDVVDAEFDAIRLRSEVEELISSARGLVVGVAERRPPPYERHISRVKSSMSLAINSNAAEYRSLRILDSVTINSANSSSRS